MGRHFALDGPVNPGTPHPPTHILYPPLAAVQMCTLKCMNFPKRSKENMNNTLEILSSPGETSGVEAGTAEGHNGPRALPFHPRVLGFRPAAVQHCGSGGALRGHRPGGSLVDKVRPPSVPHQDVEEGQLPDPSLRGRPTSRVGGPGGPRPVAADLCKGTAHR